jgi:CRISPR-associated protein Cas5d
MLSKPICLRVKGPFACFTRPEFHTERVSYPVITPSAARGVFEAILMKPIEKPLATKRHNKVGFRWVVERIGVVRKGYSVSILRNEVQSPESAKGHLDGLASSQPGYDISTAEKGTGHRAQRHSLILSGGTDEAGRRLMLEYLIEARIEVPGFAGVRTGPLLGKYFGMFQRYARKGQCHYQPFLGCREFAVDSWELVEKPPERIPDSPTRESFGRLFLDFDYKRVWDRWPSRGADTASPRPDQDAWPPFGHQDAVHPTLIPGFDAVAVHGWIAVQKPPPLPIYERSHFIAD